MDRKEEIKELINEVNKELDKQRNEQELTIDDINSFKKVLYHLNKDVPYFDTSAISKIVEDNYNPKSDFYIKSIKLPDTEHRRYVKEEHQKKMDTIR